MDKDHYLNSEEYRQLLSDRSSKLAKGRANSYSRCKRGYYNNGEKKYYMRSSWELNYARYLDFLQQHNEIDKWEYEADTFWFHKILRGVRSYTPDFKVYSNNNVEYHEVKGWFDQKSKTKIKRMAKYYSDVKLIVIGKKEYLKIAKYKKMIKGWEE